MEQAACRAHTISVQHSLEMHKYMHETVGHDRCKTIQGLLGNNYI